MLVDSLLARLPTLTPSPPYPPKNKNFQCIEKICLLFQAFLSIFSSPTSFLLSSLSPYNTIWGKILALPVTPLLCQRIQMRICRQLQRVERLTSAPTPFSSPAAMVLFTGRTSDPALGVTLASSLSDWLLLRGLPLLRGRGQRWQLRPGPHRGSALLRADPGGPGVRVPLAPGGEWLRRPGWVGPGCGVEGLPGLGLALFLLCRGPGGSAGPFSVGSRATPGAALGQP